MSSFAPGTDPRVMAAFNQQFPTSNPIGRTRRMPSFTAEVMPADTASIADPAFKSAQRDMMRAAEAAAAGRVDDFNRMASGIPGFPSFNAARPVGGQTLGSMPSDTLGTLSHVMPKRTQDLPEAFVSPPAGMQDLTEAFVSPLKGMQQQQQPQFNPYQQQQQQQPQFSPYQQFQQFQQPQFNPYQQQFQQPQFNPMMGGGFNPMMGGGFNPMMGGYGGGFNPMMGGYGGGFNPMMGGYGGGFNPMMGGIGGFFGGQSGMQFGQQGPANAGPRARTPDLSMFGGQSTNPSRNFSNPAPQPGLGSQPNPGPQQPAQSQGSGGGGLF